MSQMNEADFEKLREHLDEVVPIFDDFCKKHGFAYVPRQALGRYPRIRIEKAGDINRYFDLWMELDKDGRRFEKFDRHLPYELAVGASVVEKDGNNPPIRYQSAFVCFSGKPFDEIHRILLNELENHLLTLQKWDVCYLKQNGNRIAIRA